MKLPALVQTGGLLGAGVSLLAACGADGPPTPPPAPAELRVTVSAGSGGVRVNPRVTQRIGRVSVSVGK